MQLKNENNMKINLFFYYEGPLGSDYSWTFHLIGASFSYGEGLHKDHRQFNVAISLLFWSLVISFTRIAK